MAYLLADADLSHQWIGVFGESIAPVVHGHGVDCDPACARRHRTFCLYASTDFSPVFEIRNLPRARYGGIRELTAQFSPPHSIVALPVLASSRRWRCGRVVGRPVE